jgi:pimeloyl-ACP methyl ester carboxylesterase
MDGKSALAGLHDRLVRLPSGRRFGIAEYGDPDGLPVLAFHGAPASRVMFDVTDADARRLGLRIIAVDRPGYGLSPLDYGATLSRRTDAFAELVDMLALDRLAVLGVSGGGPYAVALAARLGGRIDALALISPLGPVAEIEHRSRSGASHSGNGSAAAIANGQHNGHDHDHEATRLTFGHRAFFLDLAKHSWLLRINAEIAMRSFRVAPNFFAHTFAHLLPEADRRIVADPAISRSIIDMTMEATRTGIGGGIADLEIYSEPWHVDYAAITAPSTIWQGLEDLIVPVGAALQLGTMIRGCRVERIAHAGHFWVYRQVGAVLGELRDMIDASRAPGMRDAPAPVARNIVGDASP